MKPYAPLLMVLVLVSTSFVGVSYSLEKSSTISYNGKTLYVGGDGPGNYTKIQDAIDNASDGDTVFVCNDSSPYYERLLINKPLNLVGESRDSTVIDGNYLGNVVVIQSDNVTVNGFKIINCVMGNQTKYVIHISDSKNVVIKDNYISVGKNFPIYGIHGIGIFIDNSSYNIIQNNIIFKEGIKCVTMGIWVKYPSNYNNYSGNEIYGYSNGIETEDSNNNVFYKNNIHHNEWGMFIEGNNNYIINNKINNNEYSGIWLECCRDTIVYGNTIAHNEDDGIVIDGGKSFSVINNNILYNKPRGIFIYYPGFSSNNIISKNNLIFNKINAGFVGPLVRIRWYNNYWGRPRILPKIIFGWSGIIVVCYLVIFYPLFNFDWFPAKIPYLIEV